MKKTTSSNIELSLALSQFELKPIKVLFEGKVYYINIQEELEINRDETKLEDQLVQVPHNYFILCSVRDNYIKRRNLAERKKITVKAELSLYFKQQNERATVDALNNLVHSNKKYLATTRKLIRLEDKVAKFISICRAYEYKLDILRTLSANLRRVL